MASSIQSVTCESMDTTVFQSSDETSRKSSAESNIETRICLVGSTASNEKIKKAIQEIEVPYLTSQDGLEYINNDDPTFETIFVLDEFQGNIFLDLKASDNRIIGPPILYYVAQTQQPLPFTHRPLYCSCMSNLNLCFTNFKTATHLNRLVSLCHYMGASVKRDMSSKIDFLITNSLHGPKYRTAVSLGITVVKEDWIHLTWAERDREEHYLATDAEFIQASKAKPFEGCVISFLGFSDGESSHMKEQAVEQGGKVDDISSPSVTHLVVDDNNVKVLPLLCDNKPFIVTQEWFWESIQLEARGDASLYPFQEASHMLTRSRTCTSLVGGTPTRKGSTLLRNSSSVKRRLKSRRREEVLAKLAANVDGDVVKAPPRKRLSKDTSACINESLLDISTNTASTRSPQVKERRFTRRRLSSSAHNKILSKVKSALSNEDLHETNESVTGSARKRKSDNDPIEFGPCPTTVTARYQVAMELLQTETNYIGILSTIINLFKKPLEKPAPGARGGILPAEDVKAIFGSIEEIYEVHQKMAHDLKGVLNTWNANSCVGEVINKYASQFVRCYPPFVNFFDTSKRTIQSCEAKLPRFHAFLKLNQGKKECGRQTLAELLINPVQRLPRIILLLQDIKKHTERENASHPDVGGVGTCIDAVKEVMTHINEDRRKTESQKQIFDIVYEVEDCPPTIVSSHRQFITRAEVIAADDNLCTKGEHINLILFTDCIEIAKKKKGARTNSHRGSPSVHAFNSASVRNLKHVKLLSLAHVRKVVDVQNSEDCQSAFALYCRTPTDTKDWLYTFRMISCQSNGPEVANGGVLPNDEGKSALLKLLARYHANTVCKASDDDFIYSVTAHELDVSTTDIVSTFGKAVRAAKKSRKKLTKAFSFSRTPHRIVQRAVTNTMTPSPVSMKNLAAAKRPLQEVNNCNWDSENDDNVSISSESGLTPSMSVTSLFTPQKVRHESNTSLQRCDDDKSTLKRAISTVNIRKPACPTSEFPAMPTPPIRRKRNPIKAATIALGRSASFRRKHPKRLESQL